MDVSGGGIEMKKDRPRRGDRDVPDREVPGVGDRSRRTQAFSRKGEKG